MKKTKSVYISIPLHVWEKFLKYRKIINISGLCTKAIENTIIAIEKSDLKL